MQQESFHELIMPRCLARMLHEELRQAISGHKPEDSGLRALPHSHESGPEGIDILRLVRAPR